MKKTAVIVDIDGTVAHNDGHRKPFDWDKVSDDTPIPGVIKFLKVLEQSEDLDAIIYVSGRMDCCLNETAEWIVKHVGAGITARNGVILFMRATGDYRPDTVAKEEIYREFIEPYYDVVAVLDDRTSVVKMWRKLGLTCLQVAQNDF